MSQSAIPEVLLTSLGHVYLHEYDSGDLQVKYFRSAPIARTFKDIADGRARFNETMTGKSEKYAYWIVPAIHVAAVIADLDAI
ncbi:hypothetical protein SKA58_19690 [Sphingomonas sp. SKA58]|jgi:hypothetical protein|uniref:hypothetical protein n=1 Tax=Sphingomonas sp. (strain SKA58) TaxID=314266 RepID=UPI0000D7A6F5|nr:hypothetical protein [Sphingomonas sp. SKA58]EAT07487.1 hypothetical protein SKA58_19690 [Sphingomonas sp. SKA58]